MTSESGFVDLRLNQQEGQGNESFWPSFTDIMTVIVMIFLIAMVVLLMRNIELVKELRSTMEAERLAWELARATGAEKATLSSQLHAAQEQVSALRLQIMRLQERNFAHENTIAEQQTTIAGQRTQLTDLTAERDALNRQNLQLSVDRENLEVELEGAQIQLQAAEKYRANLEANVARLEQNLDATQAQSTSAQQRVSELQREVVEQQRQLEASLNARRAVDRKYQTLTGEFDELKVAYNKLIRPARSPEGRRLVEVRYWKQGGTLQIAYREGGNGTFEQITREALDQRLAHLRDRSDEGLYVKVIFPEDSGLSYNEAFGFTSHLHRKYDYYFQEPEDDQTSRGTTE